MFYIDSYTGFVNHKPNHVNLNNIVYVGYKVIDQTDLPYSNKVDANFFIVDILNNVFPVHFISDIGDTIRYQKRIYCGAKIFSSSIKKSLIDTIYYPDGNIFYPY